MYINCRINAQNVFWGFGSVLIAWPPTMLTALKSHFPKGNSLQTDKRPSSLPEKRQFG